MMGSVCRLALLCCRLSWLSSGASDETCSATGTCGEESLPTLSVRFEAYKYNEKGEKPYGGSHLRAGLAKHGFTKTVSGNNWDLLWTHNSQGADFDEQVGSLAPRGGQMPLANNCAYFRAAGQKCYFAGHMRRVVAALGQTPTKLARFSTLRNLVLNHQEQFDQWREEARADPKKAWVYKDCTAGMSSGVEILRGKELLKRIKDPKPDSDTWTVVQEYLVNIFMGFGGSKFHLRVYAFITQWHPSPHVFVFNEGVLFRSKHKYNPKEPSNERDVFSHIRDDIEAFPHSTWWSHLDDLHAKNASSPAAQSVKEHMFEVINAIFSLALQQSFGKTADFDRKLKVRGYNCFDLYGLDVMFNDRLEPIVLEVNTGPNMEIDDRGEEASGLLKGVKGPLIDQLAHFSRLRIENQKPLDAIEEASLVGFTRVV